MYSSMILILGVFFGVIDSQTNVLWSNSHTSRTGLTKLCQKSPMNRISRTFFCHLLPAMNIQLEWDHKNNEQAQFNTHIIESQLLDKNPELSPEFKDFPFESYYSVDPNYGVSHTLPLKTDNIFPQKYSNSMKSNIFEDLNQFDSSEQIQQFFNNFDNPLIESPLITNDNIVLNHKINKSMTKWPSILSSVNHFEDFSSNYKSNRNINSLSLVANILDKNKGNNRNGWIPFYKKTDKPNKIKNNEQIEEVNTSSEKPIRSSKPYSWPQKSISLSVSHQTSTTTSSPIITIPSYIRRKYLLDMSRDVQQITPRNTSNNLHNSTKNWLKALKNRPKIETFKDWSKKITNDSNDWFPSSKSEKKINLLNNPKNEIIVQKLHSNYTKSSVIYTIEDSFKDKTRKNGLNDEKDLNRIEIKTISKITKSNLNSEIRGKPGIDYPIYSPSVWSNFTCSSPGFFADKQFGCQVYHHCQRDYHQNFICPNGTLFNIGLQSCDYWFNVKCDHNHNQHLFNSDFKTQINKNENSNDFLRDEPKDSQIIEDIKVFVENISKSKH